MSFSVLFSQDPQLFENTWYLQNVIIDGEDNFPPFNSEVNNIPLDISTDMLSTQVCAPLGGGDLTFDPIENIFIVASFVMFPDDCLNQENQMCQNLYLVTFFQPQQAVRIFNYQIEENTNNSKLLTLTNEEDNRAIYGEQLLNITRFSKDNFILFPNPAQDILVLSSPKVAESLKIKIVNLQSKLLATYNFANKKNVSIDVSNLSSGMYFLNIDNNNGLIETKKFVKN